ncbi:hypothetical protein ACVBEG_19210 [Pseudomonas sp. GG8]
MNRLTLFPAGIIIAFSLSLFLATFRLSYFYDEVDLLPSLAVLVIVVCTFIMAAPFSKLGSLPAPTPKEYSIFYIQTLFVFIYFLVELGVYGIPLLGLDRSEFTGVKTWHVLFYGFLFYLNVKSSTLKSLKPSVLIFIVSSTLGALMMTRQLMMYSFLVLIISLTSRGKLKAWHIVTMCALVSVLFGMLGNIRESGDGDYILKVGGANDKGLQVPSSLYWMWLYIVCPIYNLSYNFKGHDIFEIRIDDVKVLLVNIFVPEFLYTRLDVVRPEPDYVMPHLNVASGFGLSVKYAGVFGVLVHSLSLLLFYLIGIFSLSGKYKVAFTVHFSACAILFFFNNTFTQAEYYLVFSYIYVFAVVSSVLEFFTSKCNQVVDGPD